MKIAQLDIEIFEPDGQYQAQYLVHGYDDVMWTDSLNDALEFLRESVWLAKRDNRE